MKDGMALRSLGLFGAVPGDVLDDLAAAGRDRSLAPGQNLITEGEPDDDVMIVLDGEASVGVAGVIIGTIGPGDCVGEMAALDRAPRSATVTATTPMRALVVPAERFAALLAAAPHVIARLTATLLDRLRQAQAEWAGLAGDPRVLREALLQLQSSPDPAVAELARRNGAIPASTATPATATTQATTATDPLEALTPAERRVAALVAEGLSNAAVAERLVVSRHTVDTHVKHVYTKLGLRSRVELAALVIRGRP